MHCKYNGYTNYKLKLVKKNIQDYSENKTRFLVIGKNDW